MIGKVFLRCKMGYVWFFKVRGGVVVCFVFMGLGVDDMVCCFMLFTSLLKPCDF